MVLHSRSNANKPALDERLAYAQDFQELQGLPVIMMSTSILLTAIAHIFESDDSAASPTLQVLSIAFMIAFFPALGWYSKRYGVVRPRISARPTKSGIAIGLAMLAGFIGSEAIPAMNYPVTWGLLVIVGAVVVGSRRMYPHTGLTPWHWVAVAMLAVPAFFPLWGWPGGIRSLAIGIGASGQIWGTVDHIRLIKHLPLLRHTENASDHE